MTSWLFLDILRLVVALLCLAAGFTAWARSHTLTAWKIALGATEFGHYFAIVPLVIVVTGSFHPLSLVGTVLALGAMGIFLAPAVQAASLAGSLGERLESAFGRQVAPLRFSWKRLFFGHAIPPIRLETFIYDEAHGLRLNFYRSVSLAPSPCVIVLHTGGWGNGAPEEFLTFNDHIAREGFAVASIQYRLAPEWPWPAQCDDVRRAMAWLRARQAELGLDPSRFVLLGRSAGGQIAESVAYLENDPCIRGCIAFYAPADMLFSYRLGREEDILKSPLLLRNFLGGKPSEQPEAYRNASPILNVTPHTPPTLLLHGLKDSLVWYRQSERLAKVLSRTGVKHLYIALPWATHAFDYNHHGPGGQLAKYAVDYFLNLVTQDLPRDLASSKARRSSLTTESSRSDKP